MKPLRFETVMGAHQLLPSITAAIAATWASCPPLVSPNTLNPGWRQS